MPLTAMLHSLASTRGTAYSDKCSSLFLNLPLSVNSQSSCTNTRPLAPTAQCAILFPVYLQRPRSACTAAGCAAAPPAAHEQCMDESPSDDARVIGSLPPPPAPPTAGATPFTVPLPRRADPRPPLSAAELGKKPSSLLGTSPP